MKKFFMRLFLLILVVFSLQLLLGKFPVPFEPLPKLDRYLRDGKIDVLYLGDCTEHTRSKHDTDRRTMTGMLKQLQPDLEIGTVTGSAYHLGIYNKFCAYIARQSYHPKTIIIPINIRSFSPQWDMMPQYQFEREIIILEGGIKKRLLYAFYKPLRAFGYDFFTVSRQQYQQTPVFFGRQRAGTVSDYAVPFQKGRNPYTEKKIRKKTLLFYMFALDKNHRKLHSLLEMVNTLKREKIIPVLYFTPIDYQGLEKYFPSKFTAQLKENINLIRNLLKKENVTVLDFTFSLSADCFIWTERGFPSEQLNQKGRRFLAERFRDFFRDLSGQSHSGVTQHGKRRFI